MRICLYLIIILLAGCSIAGPTSVETSRTDYNISLQRTDDEQLLLNIVRFRYQDRPLFLQNSSLTTSFNFSSSLTAGASILPNLDDPYSLSGNLYFSESPTISYTPLQGQDFATRLLGRIPLETLFLLDSSGWNTDRVMRVCLQRVNHIENAVSGAGPTPRSAPEYQQFQKLTQMVAALEQDDLILIDHEISGVPTTDLVFHFRPAARNRSEYRQITQMLGLDPALGQYKISTQRDHFGGNTISVQTRSFAGVLAFLSQSVDVPASDHSQGRVLLTRNAEGQLFDWSAVVGGLMRIHSSSLRPSLAAVAVNYRGHWFYIDDTNIDAKITFVMLGQLYALLSETAQGFVPALTLPVGR